MPQKNMARWLANHMANRKALRKMSELFKGLGRHVIWTLLDKEAFLARYSQMTSKCHILPASQEDDTERWIILSDTNMLQFKDANINNRSWQINDTETAALSLRRNSLLLCGSGGQGVLMSFLTIFITMKAALIIP